VVPAAQAMMLQMMCVGKNKKHHAVRGGKSTGVIPAGYAKMR
jgi:hypothetical protein